MKNSLTEESADGLTPEIESAIFETAIEIGNAEARRGFLDRTFHGDPEGLAKMQELLSFAGESNAFFIESRRQRAELAEEVMCEIPDEDLPALFGSPPGPEEPGTQIDGYLLVRRIGEGGCGIVYEAELERVKRLVAFKIIRLGMDTESVVARFEVERQALELMEHPNIAKVLDAGKTPGGRPYFVMELVRGERITSYSDQEKLNVPARLALFIQVCHAIQHAHQKGIIHRDIKPSNILVENHDGTAVPKVIDFGIAKATGAELNGRGAVTALDQLIGTPAYMSPEQVDMGGIDIDTRSDVYSLGALLYELLAGRAPFDADELVKSGMSGMRRTLLETEPPLPSAVVAATAAHQRDRERWASSLRGDLDWIVIKAMEKDRRRRYQTVNSLAMDLKRFLANEPVIARRPSRFYLMERFFRRNRIACISGIAVALSVVGGLGAATVLYLRERVALEEQARLKREAEAARTEENRLRREAQARANVSHAAILLSEGKVEEADQLLQQNPLATIDPSREAADVFRFLGGWNAVYRRWPQALTCFVLMNQANRLGDPVRTVEGLDLLMTAPAFLEAGDLNGYAAFRNEMLSRYLPAKNSLQAEHLLKSCLLLPADPALLSQLEPVAKMCEAAVPSNGRVLADWNTLAMTLFHYRNGDFAQALEWSKKSFEYPDTAGTRYDATRCLSAMAFYRLGDMKAAFANLKIARESVENAIQSEKMLDPVVGTWFARSVSRLLLREALQVTGSKQE
ncbi:MAG: protein kinase [Verrucomicrobiota bacterium]